MAYVALIFLRCCALWCIWVFSLLGLRCLQTPLAVAVGVYKKQHMLGIVSALLAAKANPNIADKKREVRLRTDGVDVLPTMLLSGSVLDCCHFALCFLPLGCAVVLTDYLVHRRRTWHQ